MKSLTIGTLLLAAGCATAQVCGISGYNDSGRDTASPPAYQVDTNATTLELCSAPCRRDSTCQSFAIGKQTCLLYAAPTSNTFAPDNNRITRPSQSPTAPTK